MNKIKYLNDKIKILREVLQKKFQFFSNNNQYLKNRITQMIRLTISSCLMVNASEKHTCGFRKQKS